ncbi:uncharacterized protein EV154DRAFT_388646, partial [Mucor mucedo]|uniref:uncharacterized protein n=1 Tax=Mucor mucedo TaxID=29922 RepID=UPI00221FBFBC
MGRRSSKKRVPTEINWIKSKHEEFTHLDFFNFFVSYPKRRAQLRFLTLVEFVEDEEKRKKILLDYKKWRHSRNAKEYWKRRQDVELGEEDESEASSSVAGNSTTMSVITTTSTTTTTTPTTTNANDATETISLAEAKRIIINSLPLTSIDSNNNVYASSLMRFRSDILESTGPLLTYESNLQHLLALSNILFIGK